MDPRRAPPPPRFSPYEPPEHEGDARPAVIFWYRVYAGVMALASLAAVTFAVLYAMAVASSPIFDPTGGADQHLLAILMVMGTCALAGLHVVAVFVPYKPWGWSLGVVAIAMGMTSVLIFVAVPLLVHWFKPTTKAAFGRL